MTIDLPPQASYNDYVCKIFESGQLTNNGQCVRQLERRLSEYLDAPYLLLTSSATLALQVAYQVLELSGEVITTPFSWVTTASSLKWVGLAPTFVDIDPLSFNINAKNIERAITPKSTAILPVHVFGNPCDIRKIDQIANRYKLRVVYDAAHGFGVRYKGKSLASHGDASVISLHATKIFHAVEGGILILKSKEDYSRARMAINNGFGENGNVVGVGINGRLSELHAAVALCLLESFPQKLNTRRSRGINFSKIILRNCDVSLQVAAVESEINYAYFPVVFRDSDVLLKVENELNIYGFSTRRYFNPPLHKQECFSEVTSLPNAENLSDRVLCLPFYSSINDDNLNQMASIIGGICPKRSSLVSLP